MVEISGINNAKTGLELINTWNINNLVKKSLGKPEKVGKLEGVRESEKSGSPLVGNRKFVNSLKESSHFTFSRANGLF